MTPATLTVIDTTGIQSYIFGSNRLRENIGASHLVEMATGEWVEELINTTVDTKLVYRGGGNVVFRSNSLEKAQNIITDISRRLLVEAPGLEIAVAHKAFDSERDPIGGEEGIYNKMMVQLAISKQQRVRSTPLSGLGVTLACRSTGLPAVSFDKDQRPVSAEITAKTQKWLLDKADERLIQTLLPRDAIQEYALSRDLDDLGRTSGESSYIAVVHADGNGMGERFKQLIEQYPDAAQNETCLEAIKKLSGAVEKAGENALQRTVAQMTETFIQPPQNWERETRSFIEGMPRSHETGNPILPFRPLVYGGDDVTFVCDGRLGLTLAATYLREFELAASALPDGKGKVYASAGVAIVKSHYPFARAYTLAEQLCKSAKKEIRERKIEDTSMLDWHIAASGILDTLTGIRKKEYTATEGTLLARPLTLHRSERGSTTWRSWEDISALIEVFKTGESWSEKRNKVKALREALREGRKATSRFLGMYALDTLPELDPNRDGLQTTGWDGKYCGYFDAIEAMDMYQPLNQTMKGEA
jgi:hypothetical protein